MAVNEIIRGVLRQPLAQRLEAGAAVASARDDAAALDRHAARSLPGRHEPRGPGAARARRHRKAERLGVGAVNLDDRPPAGVGPADTAMLPAPPPPPPHRPG